MCINPLEALTKKMIMRKALKKFVLLNLLNKGFMALK